MPHPIYTPNFICKTLGLNGFLKDLPDTAPHSALRLLLKPSFFPEVCLTWTGSPTSLNLEIRTPLNQIWAGLFDQPFFHKPTQIAVEQFTLSPDSWPSLRHTIAQELRDIAKAENTSRYCLDGMPFDMVLCTGTDQTHLHSHASALPSNITFLRLLITQAHAACRTHTCQSALSQAAKHIDLKLPITVRPLPKATNLLILGNPDDREAVKHIIPKP